MSNMLSAGANDGKNRHLITISSVQIFHPGGGDYSG